MYHKIALHECQRSINFTNLLSDQTLAIIDQAIAEMYVQYILLGVQAVTLHQRDKFDKCKSFVLGYGSAYPILCLVLACLARSYTINAYRVLHAESILLHTFLQIISNHTLLYTSSYPRISAYLIRSIGVYHINLMAPSTHQHLTPSEHTEE